MTLSPFSPRPTDGQRRWRLWVDGCGGFLVLVGSEIRVGRESSSGQSDVGLIADVPRMAGTIIRDQTDYYWQNSVERKWIEPGNAIDGLGSAKLRLRQPSALCNSAVLTLDPPHRLGGHVDAVLLMDQTLLIGPSADCHIRCRSLALPVVVSCSGAAEIENWSVKQGFSGAIEKMQIGRQITIGDSASTKITMMLESI